MSLKSTKWYYNRLKAMSVPEVFYRFKALAVNQAELHFPQSFSTNGKFAFPSKEDFYSRFFQRLDNREKIVPEYEKCFAKEKKVTLSQADELLAHKFRIFECEDIQFNGKIDWHRDFKTGRNWPNRFHAKINVYDDSMGGCKYIWELNRHQHLVTLAKAFYLTKEEKYAEEVCRQIESWIEDNPPFQGINWYSAMELAIRMISWVWAAGFIWDSKSFNSEFQSRLLSSIYFQASFVNRHLSKYSSANNHLIGEAAGLFVVGTIFSEFDNAKRWKDKSAKIIEQEALQQINPDGSPGEQATEYLLFVLDFYFQVVCLAKRNNFHFSQKMLQRIRKACEFLEQLQDSGGHIPHFGDSDDGRASYLSRVFSHKSLILLSNNLLQAESKDSLKSNDETCFWLLGPEREINKKSGSVPQKSRSLLFETGGTAILRTENRRVSLYIDCGPLGYGSMAAHGHADALNFVLTIDGQPIFVDPGTYLYHNAAEWRNYFRGTSAHNTIRIDGQNQAVAAGTFIWSKHFNCRVLSFESNHQTDKLVAQHDGYLSLPDPVIHRRTVQYNKSKNVIRIEDLIDCKSTHLVEQYFHLAPECEVTKAADNVWLIKKELIEVKLTCSQDFETEVHRGETEPPLGWYSKSFGHKEPTSVLKQHCKISGTTAFTSQIEIRTMEKD